MPSTRPCASTRHAYAAAILLALLAQLPLVNNHILFIDEASYLAQAMRLQSLHAFLYWSEYRMETKFPLGLLPDLVGLALSYNHAVLIVHLFSIAAVVASCCLLVSLSERLYGRSFPGLIAAGFWLIYLNRGVFHAAPLLEHFQAPFLLASLVLYLWWLGGGCRSGRLLFLSGLTIGLAALIKPPGLLLVVPIGSDILLISWSRGPFRLRALTWLRQLAVLAAGTAAPVALALLPYAVDRSALPSLAFNFLTIGSYYSLSYDARMPPYVRPFMLLAFYGAVNGLLLVAATINYLISRRRRGAEQGGAPARRSRAYLLLSVGTVAVMGNAVGLPKPHYIIAGIPFLMLFSAEAIDRAARTWRPGRWFWPAAVLFLCMVGWAERGAFSYYRFQLRDHGQAYTQLATIPNLPRLITYIDSVSGPRDTIWVYYNAPELYWLAHRVPASNDPTGTWLADNPYPFFFDLTTQELIRDRPAVILSLRYPRYVRVHARRLESMPGVRELLAANYRRDRTSLPDVTVYRRSSGRVTGAGARP